MMLRDRIQLLSGLALVISASVYGCSSDSNNGGPVPGDDPASGVDAGPGPSTPRPEAGAPPTGQPRPDAGGDGSVGVDLPTFTFTCPGGTIAPGLNDAFDVDGKKRKFYADFPKDTSKPMSVIFSWHGFGDNPENFRDALKFDPDGDPAVPAVIITPGSTGLLPPAGLAWDITKGTSSDKNVDLALFEAVLGCLNAQQKIDLSRIYSFGFSAGSVMTNLVYSRYPKLVAAILTESGAWMNDKEETNIVNFPGVSWNWPELDPADRGNVLLTHGGKDDVTVLNILNLEKAAEFAIPFLKAAKRTVIDCAHTGGHALHPDLPPPMIYKYLFAHRAGQPSPFAGGTLDGYPASCTLRLP